MAWDREYQFRQAFPMTHEQFLDEPVESVEWMLRIHQARQQAQQERDRQPPTPKIR